MFPLFLFMAALGLEARSPALALPLETQSDEASGVDRTPVRTPEASVERIQTVSARALTPEQEARAQRLEGRLKCPVCRTQSVRESTSFMALEMRSRIRELIAAGRSDREILRHFVDRYGDYILLEPRKEGFGLSAYLLPFLAVAAGGILLLLRMSRGARRVTAPEVVPPSPTPGASGSPDLHRVDEELKRYTL